MLALALCGALCLVGAARADHSVALAFPDELQITVTTELWQTSEGRAVEVDLPVTCDGRVNDALRGAMQGLLRETASHAGPEDRIDMRATYRVSGASWAGFLLIGRAVSLGESDNRTYVTEETIHLCYTAQAYDLATGRALTLADVFPPNSEAWARASALARETLASYYADQPRDMAALHALCDAAALRALSFLPCAGRLLLTLPLEPVLAGKRQLAQVSLPYPDFRGWMTEDARAQTDNGARPIIALTFDDGPMRLSTQKLQRNLARYGASATFFCVGKSMAMWPDLVRRSLDEGHAVGSHTMEHRYAYQLHDNELRADRDACLALHRSLLGVEPRLFRAPGGNYQKYIKNEIGWSLIQWRTSAGDTGNNTANALAEHVTAQAKDGYIILLHDAYMKTAKGAEKFLAEFVSRGFLFATVEELLYLHGVTPQPNKVYQDATGERAP